jgi:hypothetical protein
LTTAQYGPSFIDRATATCSVSRVLRFPGLADFEVSADGTKVIAHPALDTDDATIDHLYINQIIPLALSRQGQPTFHASVVTVPGGAVAFLGRSGMGKSTLAASYALNDGAFLTDDGLLIDETAAGCMAMPSHASLRLWDDSVEALVVDDIPKASQITYSSKARLLAGDALAYSDEQAPLLAAFVLNNSDVKDVEIICLNGLSRYMAWLENSFLLDVEDHELLTRHFEWTHRISGRVPTFALDFPRDYAILPKVRDAVRQHLETL